MNTMKRLLEHIGRFSLMIKGMFTKPENTKVYWKEYMYQGKDIGIGSLPIVVVISVFLGAVMTVQTAYQLVSPVIPKYIIAQVVRDSVILELAPTIISVVLAGVVGSKISSELGNMRISEQIDALEIMGINTKAYLIMPKILMSLLLIPCLIMIAIALAILGGYLAGTMSGILTPHQYSQGLVTGFESYYLVIAMTKAATFAFIISAISAYLGYHVKGGALEIGKSSTTSVVVICIVILFADYTITALMAQR